MAREKSIILKYKHTHLYVKYFDPVTRRVLTTPNFTDAVEFPDGVAKEIARQITDNHTDLQLIRIVIPREMYAKER